MQVMSTKLPDGRELHVPYSAVGAAVMEVGHAGQALGNTRVKKPRETKAEQAERENAAKQRANRALQAAEEAIEAMLATAVTEAWERSLDNRFPYKCGHCGERFDQADELIEHATGVRAEEACRNMFDETLRLASSLSNGR